MAIQFVHNKYESIRSLLESKFHEYNTPGFIHGDPVSIPHNYTAKQDIEISGFLSATLSWGTRQSIVNSASRLMELMDSSPADFLINAREIAYRRFLNFVHRTFKGDDCLFFLQALKTVYLEHGGMEAVFAQGYRKEEKISGAIAEFRSAMLKTPHLARSEKHLADPAKGSAAKRINMFLRWMVRKDDKGVDFGIWKNIRQADLMCPLDVHTGRVARKLGLLSRNQDDWKAVEELTENLRKFDRDDPVKYDYALFGLGVFEK